MSYSLDNLKRKRDNEEKTQLSEEEDPQVNENFDKMDTATWIHILSFLISRFEYCVQWKQVSKKFCNIIENPMFGKLVHLGFGSVREQWWKLPYQRLHTMNIMHEVGMNEWKSSKIRYLELLVIDVSLSRQKAVVIDFMKEVTRVCVEFEVESLTPKNQKFVFQALKLPMNVEKLEMHCNPEINFSVQIETIEGGNGLQELVLWADNRIHGSEQMWKAFFTLHQCTLHTLTVYQGHHALTKIIPATAISGSCKIQHLSVWFGQYCKKSRQSFDITSFSFLRTLTLDLEHDPTVKRITLLLSLTANQVKSVHIVNNDQTYLTITTVIV